MQSNPAGDQSPAVALNLNVRGLGPSATLAINERSAALRAAGREVFRLGLGQSPFPVPALVVEALQANAHCKDYLAVQGLAALRQAYCDFLERTEGLRYYPENVLVGPGTKELMFLVQLVYYGELVVPTPSWVSYAPQARIVGRPVRWLPTRPENALGVTPEALDALCREDPDRPRLLIINYPGNPTGVAYSAETLEAIAQVARRYRLLVLSDEIYSGTRFEGEHVSLARYYPEGTIISNGLSKWCGAGGWRLGAFAFPSQLRWLLEAMAAVASETYTSVSAPIQQAAVTAFQGGAQLDDYLARSRQVLGALADFVVERLEQAGATLPRPQGGFYAFPSFEALRPGLAAREIHDGASLCERLLEETGVATLPGEAFGRPPGELSLRLAYVDFDGAAALEALADGRPADRDFLAHYCAPVVTAIDRLCAFVRPA